MVSHLAGLLQLPFSLKSLSNGTISFDKSRGAVLTAFTVAGLMLAWEGPFHSQPERLLWRVSAVAITASGPGLFIRSLIVQPMYLLEKKWVKIAVCFLINIPAIIFYLFARTYLVVEAFISLLYLPESAFQQPQWCYFFPHIN